ncbi:hypothetical protein ACSQ76_07355 [Roseovarius sp. B08]|uniref:hypothetical protein n=1 Tax=Roseovarius sp. B08 TaxID=3449223 RepID=UPI003EDC7549
MGKMQEILNFIDALAETGSNYRIEEMEPLYTEDLAFLALMPDGTVTRFSKQEIFSEFSSRRDAGEPPLSTEKKVLHVEAGEYEATVILFRQMSQQAHPAFYELRLRKSEAGWQVCGETVLPWPELTSTAGFLPPRTQAA